MARFDLHTLPDGTLVVECQADYLSDIGTRFVVPLLPRGEGPPPNQRINPQLDVLGDSLVLVVQLATTVRTSELRRATGSLEHEHYRIIGAIDTLIGTA